MIEIFIEVDKYNCLKKLNVSGHSNFDKKGKDIVCAGVSTLAQTALYSLKQTEEVKFIDDDGLLEIKIDSYKNREILYGITLFLITGFLLIKKEYTKYININIKEI